MQEQIFIKGGGEYQQVPLADIQYVEAQRNHVRIVTEEQVFILRNFISHIEAKLPAELFCRVHRSFIVSLKWLRKFNHQTAIVGKTSVPVGREYIVELKNRLIMIYDIKTEEKMSFREMSGLVKKLRRG